MINATDKNVTKSTGSDNMLTFLVGSIGHFVNSNLAIVLKVV